MERVDVNPSCPFDLTHSSSSTYPLMYLSQVHLTIPMGPQARVGFQDEPSSEEDDSQDDSQDESVQEEEKEGEQWSTNTRQ